jgi:hypothetical protein
MILTGETRRNRHFLHPLWTEQGANPALRGGELATYRLHYGTATYLPLLVASWKHVCNRKAKQSRYTPW